MKCRMCGRVSTERDTNWQDSETVAYDLCLDCNSELTEAHQADLDAEKAYDEMVKSGELPPKETPC